MLTRTEVFQAAGQRLRNRAPLAVITYGEAMDLYNEVKAITYKQAEIMAAETQAEAEEIYEAATQMWNNAVAKVTGRYVTAEELVAIQAENASENDDPAYALTVTAEDVYGILDGVCMYMDLHDLQEMIPAWASDRDIRAAKALTDGYMSIQEYQEMMTAEPSPLTLSICETGAIDENYAVTFYNAEGEETGLESFANPDQVSAFLNRMEQTGHRVSIIRDKADPEHDIGHRWSSAPVPQQGPAEGPAGAPDATAYQFSDPYALDAIANAPTATTYSLTNYPEEGPLLIVRDGNHQPWILKMPQEEIAPFLEAMAAAGHVLTEEEPEAAEPPAATPAAPAETQHIFADSNMGDAIANAPAAAKYRLTNDPDIGCLLIMENPETDKQPWVLKMPIKDWSPFLDAMAAAGKTLVPDRDPDDEHDVTPIW